MKPLLDKAKKLAEAATPGPWEERVGEHLDNHALPRQIWSEFGWVAKCEMGKAHCVPNAAFIAASRELVPFLVQIVEKQAEVLENIAKYDPDKGIVKVMPNKTLRDIHILAKSALAECSAIAEKWGGDE